MSSPVLIAENHEVTRWGVETIAEDCGGEVVATPKTGPRTLTAIEKHKPRMVILSLNLPRLSGFEVLRHLDQRLLDPEIMVLTTRDDRDVVHYAFDLGVTSYMLKTDPTDALGAAFEATMQGERALSPTFPETLLNTLPTEDPGRRPHRALTERQREVLALTAEGYTGREMGERLGVSRRTVEEHQRKIRETLGLSSVVELTRYAVEVGFCRTSSSEWLAERACLNGAD